MDDPTATVAALRAMLDLDVVDTLTDKVTIENAIELIGRWCVRPPTPVDPQLVVDMTIRHVPGVSADEFYFSADRYQDIARARQIAVGLIRELCPLESYPTIAVRMCRPSHSSCVTMMRRFEMKTIKYLDKDFIAVVGRVRWHVIEAHKDAVRAAQGVK